MASSSLPVRTFRKGETYSLVYVTPRPSDEASWLQNNVVQKTNGKLFWNDRLQKYDYFHNNSRIIPRIDRLPSCAAPRKQHPTPVFPQAPPQQVVPPPQSVHSQPPDPSLTAPPPLFPHPHDESMEVDSDISDSFSDGLGDGFRGYEGLGQSLLDPEPEPMDIEPDPTHDGRNTHLPSPVESGIIPCWPANLVDGEPMSDLVLPVPVPAKVFDPTTVDIFEDWPHGSKAMENLPFDKSGRRETTPASQPPDSSSQTPPRMNPPTPPSDDHQNPLVATATLSSTPTKLGRTLKAYSVVAKRVPKKKSSTLKDTAYPPDHENQRVRQEYVEFLARQNPDSRPPSDTATKEFVSRAGVVARLFFVTPPPDPAAYAERREMALDLIFMTDENELNALGRRMGDKVVEYLQGVQDSLTGGIAARMFALRDFRDEILDPPINLSWNYLILHQILFEKVAIQHPQELGFPWESAQSIQERVNNDLIRLFAVALEDEVDVTQRHSIKKSFQFFLEVCLAITKKLYSAADHESASYHAILASSMMFQQLAAIQGFRTFANQAAMSATKQKFLLECVWRDLCPQSTENFKQTLQSYHNNVTPRTLRPFLYTSARPTVLSFIHLVAQSLVDEHPLLTLQMVESALQLPEGYLTTYEEKSKGNTKSYVELGWALASKVFGSKG